MLVWLALLIWLLLVGWSLAVVRATGGRDPLEPGAARRTLAGRRRHALVAVQAMVLVAAVAGAALLSTESQWEPPLLVALLTALVLGGDVLVLDAKRFRIGGSFTGLVLAMALLGPAPAVAIGLAVAGLDALRRDIRGIYLLNNLVTYALFPLLGAIALQLAGGPDASDAGTYAVAVFVVFLSANALNFVLVAGHSRILLGGSLWQMIRTVFAPVLPWEVASGVLCALAVFGFGEFGPGIIGLFALALGVYQLLLRSLLEGQANSEVAAQRADQLDVRHEGMLGLLLETLALRDPSAARHAAAVAHYAYELARAAGLTEREQAVVHTAGLLHDIGKESLPDHILLGRGDLHPAERRLIERHPADGARMLLRVEGMGEIATAVLAHHERIDGRGYPDGLMGESIPTVARILAVAETYDVLTAPDSYRIPLDPAEAEDELRGVAGTQLDGRLVWLFVTKVLRGRTPDGPGRPVDLESELQIQRRVRGMLDQPFVLGPPTV